MLDSCNQRKGRLVQVRLRTLILAIGVICAPLSIYSWLRQQAELRQYFMERGTLLVDSRERAPPVVQSLLRRLFGTDPLSTPEYGRIDLQLIGISTC